MNPPNHSALSSSDNQATSKTVIRLRDVAVAYQDTVALYDIDLDIHRNQFVGIAGPNGSGKTTLLKTILGAVKPFKGSIQLFGEDTTQTIPRQIRHRIGYVPQMQLVDRNFPALVEDVVAMGRFSQIGLLGRASEQDKEYITKALKTVEMLHYACRPIGHLSGGQQQKVWIARALAQNTEILLLDEPTSALDFKMTRSILELLKKLHEEENLTILMIQHNLTLMKRYVKRMLYLNKSIYFDGDPKKALSNDNIDEIFYM